MTITKRYDALCATVVSATTFCGTTFSATTLSAINLKTSTITATTVSATISADTVKATTVTATNLSSTNVCATTITATTFSGSDVKATMVTATNLTAVNVSATTYQNLGAWVPSAGMSAQSYLYDDFQAMPDAGGTTCPWYGDIPWAGYPDNSDQFHPLAGDNGILRVHGDGAQCPILYPYLQTSKKPYNAQLMPVFEARYAHHGPAANAVFLGLGSLGMCAQPSSGIWFRSKTGGQIVGGCTNGGNASMVSAATIGNSGVYHTVRAEATCSSVNFYVDGVSIGTVTSEIPSANTTMLLFSVGSTGVVAEVGFDLDYVWVSQNRPLSGSILSAA